MYVPFWLFDANASGSGQYEATTSSSHCNGDYVITTTRHYDVRRAGTTQFMGVPVDGSTKMPNGHMDAIEPYDYRAFQPFSTAYLPGYMADKYDEDADTCQARAHSRMQNSVSSELSASITGYNSVSTLSENIHIDYTAKEGLWFSLPTTTEKLQAALREIGISADNPQDFFLYDYRSPQARPIKLPRDMVLSAGMDELNFLAARLEKLDATELTELNAALTSPQSDFTISARLSTIPKMWTFMCICRMSPAQDSWATTI